MTDRAPYSRVYWAIRNDPKFRGIYSDDHHLAAWLRLLIAADATWPAPADVPANARRTSVKALAECGLVDLLGNGLFTVHGLDAERGRRKAAASGSPLPPKRDPDGTQVGTTSDPDGSSRAYASRDSRAKPSLAEPRQAEPSNGREADALDAYYSLTLRYPSGRVKDWLTEIANEFGHRDTATALASEHMASPDLQTLISRTKARLASDAEHAARERSKPKPRPHETSEDIARREHDRLELVKEWTRQVKDVPA